MLAIEMMATTYSMLAGNFERFHVPGYLVKCAASDHEGNASAWVVEPGKENFGLGMPAGTYGPRKGKKGPGKVLPPRNETNAPSPPLSLYEPGGGSSGEAEAEPTAVISLAPVSAAGEGSEPTTVIAVAHERQASCTRCSLVTFVFL